MSGEFDTYIVRLSGKELSTVTGKVKGFIQNYVKMSHRFPDAEFSTHRREGWIRAEGVSEEALREAVVKAQSGLLPYNRFDFEIVLEKDAETPARLTAGDEAQQLFVRWTEQAQREWEERAQGYEQEIGRLQTEIKRLAEDKDHLLELIRQEKDRGSSLQRSYGELSSLVERLSTERVRPPDEAAKLWVGDWSVVGLRVERELAKAGFSGQAKDLPELLAFDLPALRSAVQTELGQTSKVPEDLAGIEALARVGTWEDSTEYQALADDFRRAKAEEQYVLDLKDGKVAVPESLRDTFLKAVNVDRNRNVIADFEAREKAFRLRTASSSKITQHLARFRTAETTRALRSTMEKEKPIPAVLTCAKGNGKWNLELLLPASDGFLANTWKECVQHACEEDSTRGAEETREENILKLSVTLPGTVQGWKDASRKEERFTASLLKSFQECGLQALGVSLSYAAIVEVPTPQANSPA